LKEADYDISGLEGEEASHFQVDQALQFAQLDKKFELRIAKLFKKAGSSIKLDLKEVILLNSQYIMDLFCNAALVSKISKSISNMRLKSNVSTMVTRKAIMEGYNKTVWFSTRAITNIIAIPNLIDQYRVTYDSDDLMFVVHREYQEANQVCRNRTKPVQDLELPVHEGFQVGNSEQSNQRLPHDDSKH
jgi:hypothetical protein